MSSTETETNTGVLKFFTSYEDFVKQVKESSIDYFPNVTDEQIKSIYDTLLKLQGDGVEFTIMEMSSAIQNLLWQLQNSHALSLQENLMPNYNAPVNKKKAEPQGQESNDSGQGSVKKIETTLTKLKKHKHSFAWPLPQDMEAENFMLIMGVAATEGEFKSGDIFTADNLTYAAGAMSTAAMFGASKINTDHVHDKLPEKYQKKYGLVEGTHGAILDAAVETNSVVDGDGKTKDLKQVEWIGYTTDKKVFDLIGTGAYIGCSVEDYARKAHCDCGEKKCNCTIEGSHFIDLGLILEEVPDSHGTWVRQVTPDDLAQWRKAGDSTHGLLKEFKKMTTKMQWHVANLKAYSVKKKAALEDYMDMETGVFHDGKAGIQTYLMEDIGLTEYDAKDIADYLFSHPKAINVVQMEYMSAGDWVAWFRHKQNEALEYIQRKLRLQLLQKTDVNYVETSDQNQCKGCRWYHDAKCNLVEGDIAEGATCDRFEATPGDSGDSGEGTVDTAHADEHKKEPPKDQKPKVRKLPTALIEPNPVEMEEIKKHKLEQVDLSKLLEQVRSYSAMGQHRINVHEFNKVKELAEQAIEYAIELSKKN